MKYQNVDLKAETVEVVTISGVEKITLRQLYARTLGMKFLHWDGILFDCLTTAQHIDIYENVCDGFGLGGYPEDFDWSHIRDSSWEAWDRFGDWLETNNKIHNGFNNQYKEVVGWATELQNQCDPIEFFI